MASINDLYSIAGTAQEPQDTSRSFTAWQPSQFDVMALGGKRPPPQTAASLGWPAFAAWRFAPDNAASEQTIANLARGMDLAARKMRTPYIVEPALSDRIADSMPYPMWRMGTVLPDDVVQDDGGGIFYKGVSKGRATSVPVPIARRNGALPFSWTPDGGAPPTMPGLLDAPGNAMPGGKGATIGPAVVRTLRAPQVRQAGQTLAELARAAPTTAVEMPQTVELLDKNRNLTYYTSIRPRVPTPARHVGIEDGMPLLKTIDGAPLNDRYVAGRMVAGAQDNALGKDALRSAIEAVTGKRVEAVPRAYVNNDPLNLIDQSGLAPDRPSGGGAGWTGALLASVPSASEIGSIAASASLRAGAVAAAIPSALAAGILAVTSTPTADRSKDEVQFVVRGGAGAARSFEDGTGLTRNGYGFSVQTAPGVPVEELARGGYFRNPQISVSTAQRLRALSGVSVNFPTPGGGDYHGTVNVPNPPPQGLFNAISSSFTRRPNPFPVRR